MKQAGRPPVWESRLDRAVLALGRTPWGRSGNGRPHGLMRLFVWIERVLTWGHEIMPLRADGILRYEVVPYPGRPITLADGTLVRRGEHVISLHWHNHALASLGSAAWSELQMHTWQLSKRAVGDFQCLAERVRDGTIPADVRTIWAETVHYRLLPRYGFTIRPAARSFRTPWARLFVLCILSVYSRPGHLDDPRALERLQLGEGWLSVDELLRRFPARGRATESRLHVGNV